KSINSSKMAALGEMAAGIAHEINNPLALIQGKAEHLSNKVKAGTVTTEGLLNDLDVIQRTSTRIAKIIKSLRRFSKNNDQSEFIKIPLKSIIEDSFEVCAENIKSEGYELLISEIPNIDLKCRGGQ